MIPQQKKLFPVDEPENDFLTAVQNLFGGQKAGNLYDWLYSSPLSPQDVVCGGHLLDRLYDMCPDYYLYQKECDLIEVMAKDISHEIGVGASLIDYGPGPVRSFLGKTLPILKNLIAPQKYVPIDVCPEYVWGCTRETEGFFPGLRVMGIVDDFYNQNLNYRTYAKPVVYFSGSSIANCPEDAGYNLPMNTQKRLECIQKQLGGHGYLLIGHDTNQDPESLYAAYSNKYLSDLILNVFYRIKRDLKTKDFVPDAFDLWAEWDSENACVKMGARAREPQRCVIGNQVFQIDKGQVFHVASSYKYADDLFIRTARIAGFSHVRTFALANNPMRMHLFSCESA